MKIKVNKNIYWSELFAAQIANLGIEDVCISPGSRNTPLTYAFAKNKSLKKHICIDERSSGYFALGIAKQTQKPVAVVTTSGTAVAELYPAIIEAYNQRMPLIICTADRPSYLRNTGANQTINQENIYSNHIRCFFDTGLPELSENSLKEFLDKVCEGIFIADKKNPGPVHFNFPFEKPFEPDSFTDQMEENQLLKNPNFKLPSLDIALSKFQEDYLNCEKIITIASPNNFSEEKKNQIAEQLNDLKIPLLADSASGFNFLENSNAISNHPAFIRFSDTVKLSDKDIILIVGDAPVSNSVLDFIEKTKCIKYSINKFGDLKDPSRTVKKVLKIDEVEFFKIIKSLKTKVRQSNFDYLVSLDTRTEIIKTKFLSKTDTLIESQISPLLLKYIPDNSNLFIGNSTVIRDFDLFSSKNDKNLKIFTNRGTSGIEGNIATALGIAEKSEQHSFLILGDLSFYYDSNSLLLAKTKKINLTIIVINNNGGGIFRMLPISNQSEIFEEYFSTPHNLNFEHLALMYGANFYTTDNKQDLEKYFENNLSNKSFNIIEVKTDSVLSTSFRREYIKTLKSQLITDDN